METDRIELAEIIRKYGSSFREEYYIAQHSNKVLNLISSCRTSKMGGHIEKCDCCGYTKNAYNSCRNRHCPKCQYRTKEKWINNRKKELLPITYYHIVFTLPDELNQIILLNKEVMYNILFKSASQTLLKLGRDTKHLGAEIGIISVLHTWGQNLMDHPHLHCIVTGGGLLESKDKWVEAKKAKHKGFFIHVNIISDLFKKKFLFYFKKSYRNKELIFLGKIKELEKQNTFQKLLNDLYDKKWITYCKRPFGGAEKVLDYLGRYTHRVAISNNRIKREDNGKIIFEWKDYRNKNEIKEMALNPIEFIRRFTLHILPEGFFKIRYYGILSSRSKKLNLEKCREILYELKRIRNQSKENPKSAKEDWKICPICSEGFMRCIVINIRGA